MKFSKLSNRLVSEATTTINNPVDFVVVLQDLINDIQTKNRQVFLYPGFETTKTGDILMTFADKTVNPGSAYSMKIVDSKNTPLFKDKKTNPNNYGVLITTIGSEMMNALHGNTATVFSPHIVFSKLSPQEFSKRVANITKSQNSMKTARQSQLKSQKDKTKRQQAILKGKGITVKFKDGTKKVLTWETIT